MRFTQKKCVKVLRLLTSEKKLIASRCQPYILVPGCLDSAAWKQSIRIRIPGFFLWNGFAIYVMGGTVTWQQRFQGWCMIIIDIFWKYVYIMYICMHIHIYTYIRNFAHVYIYIYTIYDIWYTIWYMIYVRINIFVIHYLPPTLSQKCWNLFPLKFQPPSTHTPSSRNQGRPWSSLGQNTRPQRSLKWSNLEAKKSPFCPQETILFACTKHLVYSGR